MSKLCIKGARVLTLTDDALPRRGAIAGRLKALENCDVYIADGTIQRIQREGEAPAEPSANVDTSSGSTGASPSRSETIEAHGHVLMPAFVDCHTHACFAGCRMGEWQRKLAGATYLEILESGGGIMSTVRAVRTATEQQLTNDLLERLGKIARAGTATIEIKSGYGLTTADELKMLRAIVAAGERWCGTIVPTACIGHALDPDIDRDTFIRTTIDETLPAVTAEFPGIAIDAYCEEGAWTVDECRKLFDAAQSAGHTIRIHADQFNSLGMIDVAIENGYRSVDHLEATDAETLGRLAKSESYGVMLPVCGQHLDQRFANGREFLDAGGALALATNYNPGSAPCFAMPMVIALAVRELGLTVAEALTACTANAAALLGLNDRGTIEPGKRADLILLDTNDEAQLAFEFGANPVERIILGGNVL